MGEKKEEKGEEEAWAKARWFRPVVLELLTISVRLKPRQKETNRCEAQSIQDHSRGKEAGWLSRRTPRALELNEIEGAQRRGEGGDFRAEKKKRGWVGGAATLTLPSPQADSAWIWATPSAAAVAPASRGRAASTTWKTAPATLAPTAALAWREAARAAAPAR